MNSYSDVDGVPAGANPWLLTEVLREEWGFEGTVVSDYWAVPFLASMHRVAPGHAEAGALALEAGIDVELPDTLGYGDGLVELVRSGALDEALVDRAARRALLAKAQARPARRRVDARGVGRARRRGRPRLSGQPGPRARDRRALGRPARRGHGAADQERAAPAAAEGGRGRALLPTTP